MSLEQQQDAIELARRVRALEDRTARIPARFTGGGSGGSITYSSGTEFPAIPESGMAFFYHETDLQVFEANAGQTVWTPSQYTTALDGVPET